MVKVTFLCVKMTFFSTTNANALSTWLKKKRKKKKKKDLSNWHDTASMCSTIYFFFVCVCVCVEKVLQYLLESKVWFKKRGFHIIKKKMKNLSKQRESFLVFKNWRRLVEWRFSSKIWLDPIQLWKPSILASFTKSDDISSEIWPRSTNSSN